VPFRFDTGCLSTSAGATPVASASVTASFVLPPLSPEPEFTEVMSPPLVWWTSFWCAPHGFSGESPMGDADDRAAVRAADVQQPA
jgi:hypothetical protein